jgi:hypothetical protein
MFYNNQVIIGSYSYLGMNRARDKTETLGLGPGGLGLGHLGLGTSLLLLGAIRLQNV